MSQPLHIVFGAGTKGKMLSRILTRANGIETIHCFLDNNPTLWGETLEAAPVLSPDYLTSLRPGSFRVHIAVGRGYAQVQDSLERMGLSEPDDYVPAEVTPISLAELDDDYRLLGQKLVGRTLLSDDRLQVLHQFARSVTRLPGSVAEVGVYRGGTALLLANIFVATDKWLHLFDTFSGIPQQTEAVDLHQAGDFAETSLEEVAQLLNQFDRVSLQSGVFPATARPQFEKERYCFVHIDADIHNSVLDSCEFFYPRLVPGGMILFDDYGFPSCPGVRQAVDSFFRQRSEVPIYLPTGQALIIRLCREQTTQE